MVLKLYMTEITTGVRATLLTAAALGIEIDEKIMLSYPGHEEASPEIEEEFRKKNPTGTIPTLDDDGFIVNDTRVILMYLSEKYGQSDDLYPEDVQKRSKVNYVLFYEGRLLYPQLRKITLRVFNNKAFGPDQKDLADVKWAYEVLEDLLKDNEYTAGDFLSIADFCVIATMTAMHYWLPVPEAKCPNITAWMKKMQALPYYNHNQEGLEKYIALMDSFRNKDRPANTKRSKLKK